MTALQLQLFLIVATRLSIGNFSSCIPEEYRGVRREIWKGINGGWYLTHLTTDKRFPKSPTSVEILRTLTPPRNNDSYYGQRLRAYFIPPVSGNFTFYATCDSECAFYLSFDERPGNKKELIRIDQEHRTGYDQWDRYPLQRSCLQQLEKRKLYYIEALHSNYIDNDHVRIHVKYPGSNTTRSLDATHLFLYSPGSSSQTTCVLLGRCDVTCGGGLETRITTREELLSGACVKQTEGIYKKAPSLLVEAYNITTSTAVIAWKPLERNESGVINVSGYRVSIKSKQDKNHVKFASINIRSLLFEDLKTFTNYCVAVEPLTGLASLEKDDCYHLRTDDDTPGLPPQNITAENRGTLSVLVIWKPVPEQYRNGIILGYRLSWKFMSAIDQQQEPNGEVTEKLPRKATVLGPNVFLFLLRDVRAFTWYCLKMLAFTRKGDGVESSCIFILTEEDVPSQAPINVTTKPLNSTSFSATWQQAPPDHVHGIVLGYKVLLENMADGSLLFTETVNLNQTQVILNGSREVSTFCVRVLAFTRKGDGKASSCTEAWTWSEETLFPDMKATNHGSPSGITITWGAPRDQVIHQLTHYRVTYEIVSEAGLPVVNSSMFSVNVSADSKKLSLDGLKTYTVYKIKVESVSLDGKVHNKKILIAETCRCPHLMLANWLPKPPYVIKDNSTSKPRGLIPEILAHMLQSSCGTCLSYKTWNITYTMNTTKSLIEPDIQAAVDFRFPVRSAIDRTKYRGSYTYVPLITVPGVAMMTRKKTPMGYARDVGHSVFGCWPIFAISYVMAILTGIVIWFAEFKSNSKHFFQHFHKGVVEGIWWSFVTMTTVGYGDRFPKTIIGRSIAILWFLTGIVLSSLLISSLTSSMSVRILDQHLNVARGKKVGSLAQFPEYDILIRYISKAGRRSSTFPSLERLVDGLRQGEVDGILVDLYTAHYRSDLFNVSWITVTRILPYEFTTGVLISGNASKLERHFREYVGNKARVVTDILQKTNQENNKVTMQRRIETKQMPLLDPRTPVFNTSVSILFSMLSLAAVIGLVYHSWYKRQQKRRYQLQAIRRRERKEYTKTRLELQQMVEEFYQRFSLIYLQMRLRHRKQLERLKINETKSLIAETMNGEVPTHSLNGTWV